MKKSLIVFLLVSLFPTGLYSQDASGQSKMGSLFPSKSKTTEKASIEKKEENLPKYKYQVPFLTAEIAFKEPSGNNMLDANEQAEIKIKIVNEGAQIAKKCNLKLVPSPYRKDVELKFISNIGDIQPGESKEIVVLLQGSNNLLAGETKYLLNVIEEKGFDLDPQKVITIYTREYQPPKNEVVDIGIIDANRNQMIEKRENVDVTIRIQNRGENTSTGTYAIINYGTDVIALDPQEKYLIGELRPGDYKDLTVPIVTNTRTQKVVLTVNIFEESKKYTTKKEIDLPFDVVQKKADEIVIAKNEKGIEIPEVANLKLDIAENIPKAKEKKKQAIAIIIGNKDYLFSTVPRVDFALNDASLIKRYVEDALGYSEENIFFYQNARQSDLINIFGTESNYKGKLYDYAVKGQSEVFIYYSGHGAPNPENKQGYIVPVDCDPNKVALNGYSLKTLFSNLDLISNEKKLKHVTVVLDACFSGNSQAGALLTNISPINISVKNHLMTYPNSTIFTSSTGEQVSNWYTEKKQGLFTYFFLKGLKGEADSNKDESITAKELYEFVNDEVNGVPYWARRLNSRTQTPMLIGLSAVLLR